jgi:hypothetical protein
MRTRLTGGGQVGSGTAGNGGTRAGPAVEPTLPAERSAMLSSKAMGEVRASKELRASAESQRQKHRDKRMARAQAALQKLLTPVRTIASGDVPPAPQEVAGLSSPARSSVDRAGLPSNEVARASSVQAPSANGAGSGAASRAPQKDLLLPHSLSEQPMSSHEGEHHGPSDSVTGSGTNPKGTDEGSSAIPAQNLGPKSRREEIAVVSAAEESLLSAMLE